MKRLLDILFSLILISITFPIMILIALLIKVDSSGPIIFRQKRVGKNGKVFMIYKFRTMIVGADTAGPVITAKDDPRITQIGHILRWLKLDELPQFFNVLKGEMTIVGPRPEVPIMVEKYSPHQKAVLNVKPGIIGSSQIANRDEEALLPDIGSAEQYYAEKLLNEKVERDLAYIQNRDPFKDLKILFRGSSHLFLTSIKFQYIFESRRRSLFLFFDIFVSLASFWFSYFIRFEDGMPPADKQIMITLLPFIVLLRVPCFIYFGLYQSLWQYLGIQELFSIIKSVTLGSLLLPLVPFLLQINFLPRWVLVFDWLFLITALGGSRIIFKLTAERLRRPRLERRKNVVIIGAEDAGELLAREFIKRPVLGYKPVAFLDDDPDKIGIRIHGIKVTGKIDQLHEIVEVKKIDEVIIALPQASGAQMRELVKRCRLLNLSSRIIPQTSLILPPQVLPLRLRPVDVSDLLGRELIKTDLTGIQDFLGNKKILVTGAGGSIGSELVRIIAQNQPSELILIDNSESNLYEIEMDLKANPSLIDVSIYLRDITDAQEMEKIFERHRPDIVYHAAAYKHVPLMESHFTKAILNNVLGTKVVADLAERYQTERFILISTDKAINPTSIMGTTKRIAELYLQSLKSQTRFLAVRFGNVFNSKGSVVPLFKRQIENGGPITITHPEITRYFMDASEAIFLILQATIMGSDSEIFVLDMGNPVKILHLAQNLIHLAGIPQENVAIKYVGLRPGEKLHEELELTSEQTLPTAHKKIRKRKPAAITPDVQNRIKELISLAQLDAPRRAVIEKMKQIVPEYQPLSND